MVLGKVQTGSISRVFCTRAIAKEGIQRMGSKGSAWQASTRFAQIRRRASSKEVISIENACNFIIQSFRR